MAAFDIKQVVASRLGENYELHEQYINPTEVLTDCKNPLGGNLVKAALANTGKKEPEPASVS